MNKINRRKQKNEKGFTMIELIIVVAIMGIIGAVLVPQFGTMSAKARLSTDIMTVKTIQRQLDIYKADTGTYPDATNFPKPSSTATPTAAAVPVSVINKMVEDQYLDSKDLKLDNGNYSIRFQTGGKLYTDGNRCYLQVDNSEYSKLVQNINANETDGNKGWVTYVPATSTNP